MAYQYTQGVALNTADFIKKLRDFVITTCGWTSIQDTVSTTGAASSYFAASSTGESGTESNVVRFIRGSANQNLVWGSMYLSWAAGAGKILAGSLSTTVSSGTYVTTDDNNYFAYWLFGSLDRIVIVTQAGARAGFSDTLYVGGYTRNRSATVVTSTNAPAAGANVVVTVANTVPFTVGKRYVICDANGFEYPKVTAINPGVSITFDILQNSYTTGARIGEDPRPGLVTPQSSAFGLGSAVSWLQAPPFRGGLSAGNAAQMTGGTGFAVRTVDQTMVERIGNPDGGPDGGGSSSAGTYDLWPLFIADESQFAGSYLGTLTECFITSRAGIATDDIITVGGNTYHYVNTAAPNTGTTTTAIGLAVRRS